MLVWVNIRTSSHGIVKIIMGITRACRSRKGMEKLNPIDDILNQARPCENFMKRIIFWTEINIYAGIIYCPCNRHKVFSPPNIKQSGELVMVHRITSQAHRILNNVVSQLLGKFRISFNFLYISSHVRRAMVA